MKQPVRHPHSRGFTLIEVLVVMIMVALIGSVLFQALEQAYRLKDRFGVELFNVQQGQMATDWYRQSVNGLYPDYADGAHVFKGGELEFSGLSTTPLSEDYGIATAVTWRLRPEPQHGISTLLYVVGKQETAILSWRGKEPRFGYLDDTRAAHDSWPPRLGQFPQLPTQIQIQSRDGADSMVLVATPMGPTAPLLRMRDVLGISP